jgi:hypothetical protein
MLFLAFSALSIIVNISSKVGHLIQQPRCVYTASDALKCVIQYSIVGSRYYILIAEL